MKLIDNYGSQQISFTACWANPIGFTKKQCFPPVCHLEIKLLTGSLRSQKLSKHTFQLLRVSGFQAATPLLYQRLPAAFSIKLKVTSLVDPNSLKTFSGLHPGIPYPPHTPFPLARKYSHFLALGLHNFCTHSVIHPINIKGTLLTGRDTIGSQKETLSLSLPSWGYCSQVAEKDFNRRISQATIEWWLMGDAEVNHTPVKHRDLIRLESRECFPEEVTVVLDEDRAREAGARVQHELWVRSQESRWT